MIHHSWQVTKMLLIVCERGVIMNRRKFFSSLIPVCLAPAAAIAAQPEEKKGVFKIDLEVVGVTASLKMEGPDFGPDQIWAVKEIARALGAKAKIAFVDVEVNGKWHPAAGGVVKEQLPCFLGDGKPEATHPIVPGSIRINNKPLSDYPGVSSVVFVGEK